MSDKDKDLDIHDAEQESPANEESTSEPLEEIAASDDEIVVDEVAAPAPARSASGIALTWLALLVAVIALAGAGYSAWQDWQRASDSSATDQLANLDSRLDASARSLRELEAKLADLEQRNYVAPGDLAAVRRDVEQELSLLNSVPGRLSTLESSIASLAGISEGARDAWVLAEAEYYMQIANAQLQLANNPQLAALALRLADERIVQLADPALTDVRRALADELAALDVMAKPDIEGATLMLASLARVVESLPLAGVEEADPDASDTIDPELGGASRAWASVKNAMSGLVKVTPPDQARLAQLSPDAEYFLRNNIAMQLQAARLALLRGEQAIFEQTLDDTKALLNNYFDMNSAQVASAQETLDEIRASVFAATAPDISASLRLLRQQRTLSETAR